jgi:hypothetical protein
MMTRSFSSLLRFLALERTGFKSVAISDSFVGESLRCRFSGDLFGEFSLFCDCVCFMNIAWMPSFRFETGSMKVGDSVPTLPTSFGT